MVRVGCVSSCISLHFTALIRKCVHRIYLNPATPSASRFRNAAMVIYLFFSFPFSIGVGFLSKHKGGKQTGYVNTFEIVIILDTASSVCFAVYPLHFVNPPRVSDFWASPRREPHQPPLHCCARRWCPRRSPPETPPATRPSTSASTRA